jgi:hypothetical protein
VSKNGGGRRRRGGQKLLHDSLNQDSLGSSISGAGGGDQDLDQDLLLQPLSPLQDYDLDDHNDDYVP